MANISKILFYKIFGVQNVEVEIIFSPKFYWGQNFYWVQYCFEVKNLKK